MFRLMNWYRDLLRRGPGLGMFEFVLWGGFWSNALSWDIDLLLVPNRRLGFMDFPYRNHTQLLALYELIAFGTRSALEDHRILIDISAAEWQMAEETARVYRAFELGQVETILIAPQMCQGYGIYRRFARWKNGQCEFDVTKAYSNRIDLGNQRFLYEKNIRTLDKQMSLIRSGRIYYEPVALDELFG